MSTEKEPDYKSIARKLAEAHFCQAAFEADPSIEQTYGWDQMLISADSDRIEAYASCMEARLRSDWETIRLLRTYRNYVHAEMLHVMDDEPHDGPIVASYRKELAEIDTHLSKLLEPFTP